MDVKLIKQNIKKYLVKKNAYLTIGGQFNLQSQIESVSYFDFIGDTIVSLDKNQKIINNNDFPNISSNYFFKLSSASREYFILVDSQSFDSETFLYTQEALYSLTEKRIIFEQLNLGDVIFDNFILSGKGKNEINVFSIVNLETLSKLNLGNVMISTDTSEKPHQVSEFCGIHENTLVCTLNSGAILLLGIQSGEVKRFFPDAKFPRQLYAKKDEPHIYCGLFSRRYIEIDILKGEIIKDISIEDQLRAIKGIPEADHCWFSVGFSVLYDDKIYFLSETNFIGVFDPATGKIIDYHEFEFDKSKGQQLRGGKENLQVKEGKIYCLDTLGNLYELQSDQKYL
ncbi:MAG: hypothetical protein JNJ99_07275 [Crocinitomicaceae bacterium]|nr:hypothetical protein [Crocinitomicaceae bacterium]